MAGGTYFRGFIPQGLLKVEPAVSIAVTKVAAYGADLPFPWAVTNAKNCSPWSRYGKPKVTSIDEAGGVFQNPAVTPDATPTYCFPFEA